VPWHKEAITGAGGPARERRAQGPRGRDPAPALRAQRRLAPLIKLNEERLALADSHEKVAILRSTARLWETRGNDELRAFAAVRAAFELDARGRRDPRELERLAEMLGAWEELS
jgi:hypothetical protein